MNYLSEFRFNWQTLMSGAVGMALGSAIGHYTLSLFAPAMIEDLGWTKAQFALIGSISLVTLPLIAVAGRFTDRFGTRVAGIIGFTGVSLGFLAMSLMSGNIAEYFAIYLLQHVFGILTTSMVFCRLVIERFDAGRGVALSLIMTTPPLAGAIAAPLLGDIIADEGWRAGFRILAAITALGGVVALSFMSANRRRTAQNVNSTKLSWAELFALLRHPALLAVLIGMLLVNMSQAFSSSQLKLVALANGVSDGSATLMVSLYAIGVIVGRFLCGIALDSKIRPHLVAAVTLSLPAVGYLMFASSVTAVPLLMLGVLVIGFAQGAEGDVGAYVLSRQFNVKNISLLLGMMTMAIGLGSALGSLVLSYTLTLADDYTPFLLLAAASTVVGAAAFAFTGLRRGSQHHEVEEAVIEQASVGEVG